MGRNKQGGWGRLLGRRALLLPVTGVVLAAAMAPALAGAWLSWDGDPTIELADGGTIDVAVSAGVDPCSISSPVLVTVAVPNSAGATVTHEESQSFICPDGTHTIVTSTSLQESPGKSNKVTIEATVNAPGKFKTDVDVTLDGVPVKDKDKPNGKVTFKLK